MKHLLLILTPLLFSCQALATLDRLELQIGQQGVQLDLAMADGVTTKAELTVLKDGNVKMAVTTENLQTEIEKVEAAAFTTGELAGGGGVMSAMAMLALNMMRNGARRKRGERTGTDAPASG